MFDIIKSLIEKITPLKAVASSKFIDTINQNHQEEKISTKDDLLEEKYQTLLNQGIESLNYFDSDPDSNYLTNAFDKFNKSIEIKKDKAEPYFYLSYIGYLQKDTTMTIKYLQIDQDIFK